MQLCFVSVHNIVFFFFYYSVCLELCINLTLGLLRTKHLRIEDRWKEGHAVIETYIFDRTYLFFPDRY